MTALTLGVEEEFLLVDKQGRLTSSGPEISDSVDVPEDGQIEHELRRCQVEAATKVCTEVEEILTGLGGLRDRLAAEAAERGQRLVPSGTAILADSREPRFTRDSRYQRMSRDYGELARASLTCACHVHVGITDRANGLRISSQIRPWLPLLLALGANSPFHDGADTRYASWRYQMWSRWPSAGSPPLFDSVDHYEASVDALLRSGAILDRAMIYWDVRLSEHQPTVEIRIADVMPTVEQAGMLALLIRGLAGQATAEPACAQPPQEVLRGQLWRAARDGMGGRCVDPHSGDLVPAWQLADTLVERLSPYLRSTDDEDYVTEALARLHETGDGAQRQRALFERRERLTDVIDGLACP
jgi:carboxylate-amine ligase